jgi:hypothetical protein
MSVHRVNAVLAVLSCLGLACLTLAAQPAGDDPAAQDKEVVDYHRPRPVTWNAPSVPRGHSLIEVSAGPPGTFLGSNLASRSACSVSDSGAIRTPQG